MRRKTAPLLICSKVSIDNKKLFNQERGNGSGLEPSLKLSLDVLHPSTRLFLVLLEGVEFGVLRFSDLQRKFLLVVPGTRA